MKVELDISGVKFDQVGTSEARIFFNVPDQLPDTVVFEVWRVDLIYTFGKSRLDLISEVDLGIEDIHIAGMSTITLTNVVSGVLDITLLDNSLGLLKTGKNYTFGGVFNAPFGSGEISLLSCGSVKIEFETTDCISIDEYCRNPFKYSYKDQ